MLFNYSEHWLTTETTFSENGGAKNAGPENDGPNCNETARHEFARHEIAGPEIAGPPCIGLRDENMKCLAVVMLSFIRSREKKRTRIVIDHSNYQ